MARKKQTKEVAPPIPEKILKLAGYRCSICGTFHATLPKVIASTVREDFTVDGSCVCGSYQFDTVWSDA